MLTLLIVLVIGFIIWNRWVLHVLVYGDARMLDSVERAATMIETFRLEHERYPESLEELGSSVNAGNNWMADELSHKEYQYRYTNYISSCIVVIERIPNWFVSSTAYSVTLPGGVISK